MGLLNIFDVKVNNPFIGNSLKSETSQQPIRTFKQLTIQRSGYSGAFWFHAITNKRIYGVEETAICSLQRIHTGITGTKPSISKTCSCGFYSYKGFQQAQEHNSHLGGQSAFFSKIITETTISGYYIEYDGGYRAEKQRVSAIYATGCDLCLKTPATAFATLTIGRSKLIGVCLQCALKQKNKMPLFTFKEISNTLVYPKNYRFGRVNVQSADSKIIPSTRYQLEHRGRLEKVKSR